MRRALARPLDPVLFRREATVDHPGMTIRRDGDRNLLVEYGDNVLDLLLRLRAGALMDALRAERARRPLRGGARAGDPLSAGRLRPRSRQPGPR